MSYMSSPSSSGKGTSRKPTTNASRPRVTRSPSASEIARNTKHFETWSTHQNMEQVSFSDIPEHLQNHVESIFDVQGKIPLVWTQEASEEYQRLATHAPPRFLSFIKEAYAHSPSLFCDSANDAATTDFAQLYLQLTIVFAAWSRLKWMRDSDEKWSEADFVANVYNVFRSPAVRNSTHRVQRPISLPQPLVLTNMGAQAIRVLNAKTIIPDCAILVPSASIHDLSRSAKSPFKILKRHKVIAQTGNASKCSSFPYQSTPCAALPVTPGFEFASSFWEDKKPVHQMLEDAYRQNRMSTASAVRHLHSLHVRAPVLGLVWANGTVRAHVDWCKANAHKPPAILSAPYPGLEAQNATHGNFHEWQLDRASDILQVYFLIRNIDEWTTEGFRDLIIEGVHELSESVRHKGGSYEPWRRVGDLTRSRSAARKENVVISATTTAGSATADSTPPKPKQLQKSRRKRLS